MTEFLKKPWVGASMLITVGILTMSVLFATATPSYPAKNPHTLRDWNMSDLQELSKRLGCVNVLRVADKTIRRSEPYQELRSRCTKIDYHFTIAFVKYKLTL